MAKKRRELVLDSNLIKRIVDVEKLGKGMNYIMEWISFMNDTSLFSKNMRIDTLYRTTAPQIVWIEEGEVEGTFNYRMYRLKKGDLLYKPSGTLFSLHSMSENLKARLIDFHIPHAMYGKLLVE